MKNVRSRLEECFLAVFPDLPRSELSGASPRTVVGWDSLSLATLMTVIEEEFGVPVPIDQLGIDEAAQVSTFESLYQFLSASPKNGASG